MIFRQRLHRNTGSSAIGTLGVIHVCTVQAIRAKHRAGGMGLLVNIIQTLALVAIFGGLMMLIGLRTSAIRGDFILYIMTGVFLFMTLNKSISATFAADSSVSSMMMHSPMNTIVSIVSAALATLYLQVMTVLVILFVYHAVIAPITIDRPVEAFGCLLLTWFAGLSIGMMFRAARPWAPKVVGVIKTVYMRVNMISSGKMFVANAVPGFMLPFFDWNPLFHTIDQARGFTFINYNPHVTSIQYPFYVALTAMAVGLLADFFTSRHESISWGAR